MRSHQTPECTGYWSPCEAGRYLTCSGCGTAFEPTPEEVLMALRENRFASLLMQLSRDGFPVTSRSPRATTEEH